MTPFARLVAGTLMSSVLLFPTVGSAQRARSAASPADVEEDRKMADRVGRRVANLERNRIVGGREAQSGAFPWAVALTMMSGGRRTQYCGSSLIADRWLLTAAHCDVALTDEAVLGRHDLRDQGGEVIKVSKFLPHPSYNAETSDFDIALVKLDRASQKPHVDLIPTGTTLDNPPRKATIVGWGRTREGGATSSVLREVELPLITNTSCESQYTSNAPDEHIQITANMMCAFEAGKDSCQGDSGGALVVRDSNGSAWSQAGVVSFGIGCARAEFPGVYTRVAKFRQWITDTMAAE
jgi:secreted trypsin-like serine protease